jgi:hypothetical protein
MRDAIWLVCEGEAHANPHIDHCMMCAPWWGEYPACPACGFKLSAGPKRVRGHCTNDGCPAAHSGEQFLLHDSVAERHEKRRRKLLE